MGEELEVAVVNKAEMDDMLKQILEQLSSLRADIDEIKARMGNAIPENSIEEEISEEPHEEEKSLDVENKPVAPAGEGGSNKKKETMNVNENEPNPPMDTGSVNAEADKIKGMIAEVVRDEIRKALETVSTPMPEPDVKEPTNDFGTEVRKGIRAILEGKATVNDVKKIFRGGV